jgi:hypothetical protein
MHRLEAGHFAVEDHLEYIAEHMRRFYDTSVAAVVYLGDRAGVRAHLAAS